MALSKVNPNFVEQTPYGRRNLIINGAMQVAQRGTSSTSAGYHTVDRWQAAFGGSGAAVTQSQESLSSSDAPYALGLRNYFRSTVTGTSTDTGAYHQILQYVEAQNMAQSGWNFTSTSSYITLSFWVRSSVAGTYAFYVNSRDGTQQSYSHAFTLSANTWTKVTKTILGNSNITINNDNGQGLLFDVLPHFGTDYTTASSTEDAWKTFDGTDICKDYGQNWLNTSGATFDITGVQLEVGETATPFEHLSYADELFACQRYYSHAVAATGPAASTTGINAWATFPREFRASPTYSTSGALNFSDGYSADFLQSSGAVTAIASAAADGAPAQFLSFANFSGLTQGRFMAFPRRLSNDNRLIADAEL